MLYRCRNVSSEYLCSIMKQGKCRTAIGVQAAFVQAVANFTEQMSQQGNMEGMFCYVLSGGAAHQAPTFDGTQTIHISGKMIIHL
ncbi:hypothetical protein D3C77_504010 [compost metagenome]